MSLSPEQIEKIQRFLVSKGVIIACPSCQTRENIASHIAELRIYEGGSLTIGAPTIPVVPIICPNCGFVRLYSAKTIGLL